jgi:3-isopropylmalate dehydrogenase
MAQESDAVYLAAVGDFKYDTLPRQKRPEQALLACGPAWGYLPTCAP